MIFKETVAGTPGLDGAALPQAANIASAARAVNIR
jgi:hypothetical protein